MRNVLKVLLWIIAIILFPITAGLYFIWPSRIFKDRMSQNWKIFWWIIYAIQAFIGIALKIFACAIIVMPYTHEDTFVDISRESVPAPDYKTSEDFYKLTGVDFPELEMVDSLYIVDNNPNIYLANSWREYKFVAKNGLSESFYECLERACVTDSTHWERMVGYQLIYQYEIYPDQEPVDRSRGMCDRMEETFNGEMKPACDGDYIIVEIMNNTIILKQGWNDLTID